MVEDDSDEETNVQEMNPPPQNNVFSFDMNTFMSLTNHEDQVNYIGEEIYIRVVVSEPKRAGMITGMILELEIAELLYMLETKDLFDARVKECIEILDELDKQLV